MESKRRAHPPKHSYTYIRESRKARRLRSSGDGNNANFSLMEETNRQNTQPNNFQTHLTAPPCERLKLLNYLPAHMIIPPGTNVSVPPPPLPLFPANLPFMRFPFRPLFLKPPPPLQVPNPRMINVFFPKHDKNVLDVQEQPSLDNAQRFKIQIPPPPPPPLNNFPLHIRPPGNLPFLDIPNANPPREFSRIFAEHTIKAALGISSNPQLPLKNY